MRALVLLAWYLVIVVGALFILRQLFSVSRKPNNLQYTLSFSTSPERYPSSPLSMNIKPITSASEASLEASASGTVPGLWTCTKTDPNAVGLLKIKSKYQLPGSSLAALAKHQDFLKSTEIGLASDAVSEMDARLLHQVFRLKCRHALESTGTCMTAETGFALAGSSISILDAHLYAYQEVAHKKDAAKRSVHYAIDPYQQTTYQNVGARGVARYMSDHSNSPTEFSLLNETAALSLSYFAKTQTCFDIIFLDDGHRFEQNIIELSLGVDLVAVGSVIILHDVWMASIGATKSWVETNLNGVLKVVNQRVSRNMLVLLKIAHDKRAWDHFQPFPTDFTNSGGVKTVFG